MSRPAFRLNRGLMSTELVPYVPGDGSQRRQRREAPDTSRRQPPPAFGPPAAIQPHVMEAILELDQARRALLEQHPELDAFMTGLMTSLAEAEHAARSELRRRFDDLRFW